MSLVNKGESEKSGLTSRQKAIIQILTQFTATNPVTVSAISEKLKLSSRTILREMPKIEKWLSQNEFKFIRKPGVGLVLDENLENQKYILELLEVENIENDYSKEERRKLILVELLSNKEPLKALYFKSKFKISEGTLNSDLEFLNEWLKTYGVSIVKRPGLGIYIDGSESGYRQAIANAVYEFMNEDDILGILNTAKNNQDSSRLEINSKSRLFNFIDNSTMEIIEEILVDIEKRMHIKYTDSAYMGLIVHISLAVKRIQNFEKIEMEQEKLSKLEMMPEFSVAEEIGKAIESKMGVVIPKDEIGFITMHLISAKIWITENKSRLYSGTINIRQLVLTIIILMEKELKVYLRDNEMLVEDLCNHIAPVISRLSMNVNIKNSQLKTIKEKYSDIYEATEKSCDILKEAVGVDKIPETEIAFIAMHFCVAVEKIKSAENKVSVVVVCPTGLGTSKMLAVNLTKYFHNIEISDIVSAINIDVDKLINDGIDFIVSTIHLSIDFPYVCVNPILLEQDKILIKNAIDGIDKEKSIKKVLVEKNNIGKDEIIYISKLGDEILNLISTVRLYNILSVKDKYELIDVASSIFAENMDSKNRIFQSLKKRENIASTYIGDLKMMLLHCKTDGVSNCSFGYVRLKTPLKEDECLINGAVVMLVPNDDNKVYMDIMSEISGALVENQGFLNAIQEKNSDDISRELEKSLLKFYKKTVLKRMEC